MRPGVELMTTIKVLLAEDHIITRQGIRKLLEDETDIQVVGEAGDGEEAVNLVKEKHPDLVIMDIAMPKLNGIEATRKIKTMNPTIVVLILTAYDDDEYIFGLLDAGAAGYLLKTASGDDLIRAINSVFKGELVLDPAVVKKVIDRVKSQGKPREPVKAQDFLSERELEVLKLAAGGMGNKAISEQLSVSRRTVEGILRTIFNKLGVGSRVEAIMYGLKSGWFKLEELS
jgi:two-component system, NarL family, response regulator LiaR